MDYEFKDDVRIKESAGFVDGARPEILVESPDQDKPDEVESIHAGRISFAQIVLGERFKVLDVIGQGGMGAVYKVKDETDRIFALKLLKPELCQDKAVLKRFQHEAAALAELDHDNIVNVYDHGITSDGAPYIVMPCLEGGTLSDLLSRQGKVAPEQAIKILLQVCQALCYAHDRKLIHRDIKPSNVILKEHSAELDGADPVIQIVDFGISKMLDVTNPATINMTQTGDVFGTPAYMSPEQCQGEDVDHRTDIYSAGCLLYEMITGNQPFKGTNAIQVALKQVSGEIESFADKCPDGHILVSLEQIVRKCMHKSKAGRYQTAEELIRDLNLVKSGREVAYEEPIAEAAATNKLTEKITRICRSVSLFMLGALAWFWYLLLFPLVFTVADFDSSSRLALIIFPCMAAFIQLKWISELFQQRKKRRSLGFWCTGLTSLTILVSCVSVAACQIADKPQWLTECLTGIFLISFPCTWLLLIVAALIRLTWLPYLFRRIKCWFTKEKMEPRRTIPISLARASKIVSSICAVVLLSFVIAWPSGFGAAIGGLGKFSDTMGANLAKPVLQLSVFCNSSWPESYVQLTKYYSNHGDPAAALKVIELGISRYPQESNLFVARGIVMSVANRPREAFGDLNKALQIDPRNTGAMVTRGNLYLSSGDFSKAKADFTNALVLKPVGAEQFECLGKRGVASYALGKFREAADDFTSLLEVSSEDRALNYVRRGLAFNALDEQDRARQSFESALDSTVQLTANDMLIKAFAQKQLGQQEYFLETLKEAEEKGANKSKIKECIFGNVPGVTLSW